MAWARLWAKYHRGLAGVPLASMGWSRAADDQLKKYEAFGAAATAPCIKRNSFF
jgi:hypothetical protein